MRVPGAADLVAGSRAMLRKTKPDAIIVLGVLIRGESDSYQPTCSALVQGLTQLNAMQDTPIVQGVLMCRDEQQALERSHGPNSHARAWAETALHMVSITQDSENDTSM